MQVHRRSDREDRRRLGRLASGDTDALEEIWDRHAERLHGHALWVLRNRQDAEDVVQTVFVKLAGMGVELLGIRRPAAYLFRMAHRETLDVLRRRRTRAEDHDPPDETLFDAGESDPERRAEVAMIERRIAALDAPQREALYLHLYGGLTFREVGKVTDVPTATAASRYRLAIERLKREIGS
jgi:RNA polymerase sigma-70 factor (ECF subfamily)